MNMQGKPSKTQKGKTQVVEFEDNRLLTNVFGQHDRNLARIEQRLGVILINRGNRVAIEGNFNASQVAKTVLLDLYQMAKDGHDIDIADVDGVVRMSESSGPDGEQIEPLSKGRGAASPIDPRSPHELSAASGVNDHGLKIITRNRVITPRSKVQADYIHNMIDEDMVFGVGPAGTGKTYLAVAIAVARMLSGEVDRIILSRPAVEAGENLGFLPGDLKEKVDPYLRPLYDALYDMLPAEQVEKKMASGEIEIAPLAYMRGRTLSNACIILDEAQNTTVMQMKMILTRFGENARMVICGDPSQVDLPGGAPSGLAHALGLLGKVKGIGVTRFTSADVVRHPLVGRIVDAYEKEEKTKDENDRAAKKAIAKRYEKKSDGQAITDVKGLTPSHD